MHLRVRVLISERVGAGRVSDVLVHAAAQVARRKKAAAVDLAKMDIRLRREHRLALVTAKRLRAATQLDIGVSCVCNSVHSAI